MNSISTALSMVNGEIQNASIAVIGETYLRGTSAVGNITCVSVARAMYGIKFARHCYRVLHLG